MEDRVFGIETEYALIYHPGRGDRSPPNNLELYRRFEDALRDRVRSLPHAFSPLRAKGGRFLENGSTFHYEATVEEYEHGLLEMASPECRDPYTLIRYERCKDDLVAELAQEVNRELALAGHTGHLRVGKNNVDSQGHTFGSHESYWVEDRLDWPTKLLVLPFWLALWTVSLPVLAIVLAVQVVVIVAVLGLVLALMAAGLLIGLVRRKAAEPLFSWVERQATRLETHPGDIAAHAHRLAAPIHPLMWLHSVLYNRFYFRPFRQHLSAFLVTRTLYAGAGAVVFDGGPIFRLAQRPPFIRSLARIFTSGDDRPIFETRDLFFRPWSVLGSHRRLHLMFGDANLCEWALLLRTGTTALVLEAIESGRGEAWPMLRDPLDALRRISADGELTAELELSDGTRATAMEIQRRYLEGVRELLFCGSEVKPWKLRLLRAWAETLEGLQRDPEALADRIDWIAKRRLVGEQVPDPEDRAALEQRGGELVEGVGPLDPADARLRELAFRAWRADLRYHELGPRGGHRRLEAAGRVRRLTLPAEVDAARTEPPVDTRAWARGRAIKWAHRRALPGSAAWHRVRIGKFGWHWFHDPLDPQG